MKSSNMQPGALRPTQAFSLETLLLWIMLALGLAGVFFLYSGTASRDAAVIVASADTQAASVYDLSDPADR